MLQKNPTSRQLQAEKTKNAIYTIAVSLMEKQGFSNTTVEEISSKAGVSIGTFYHYFKSKDDIFFDLFKQADDYFERTVAPELESAADGGASSEDLIVLFFQHYARYNNKRGIANISQLYNTKNKFFAKKGRYMQNLLTEVVERGQARKEISSETGSEEITDFFFVACRGVIYDWCVHEASYNLEQKMTDFARHLTRVFRAG